ncbi:hypothetical protein [Streptomyces lancefieldiae]|uniref:Secreted protein n=1 Tax=Streptomyces lancefieldiae TaxID=3075520 RepID=A0ABU3ARJ5_9ACTN|nr:hypothetical protein [Streptomyces sp. DSM 40712]MDT0612817.1 hypothetical protein [Streptomyces sp. DSM 40712]
MPALPARRIALGACCAALLVGITGPAAVAADPVRERTPGASSHALLVQVRSLDAHAGELAPVVDLLEAVLAADGGHLSSAEAKRLGEAAREALEEAAAKAREAMAAPGAPAPATTDTPDESESATTDTPDESESDSATTTTDTPELSDPSDDTLIIETETDVTSDLLDTVREAVDELLKLLLSDGGEDATQAPSALDGLLAEVKELIDALLGNDDPQVSTLPAPADPALTATVQVPLLAGLKLPLLTPLLPAS